jgi:cell wall assembly regulator SMI1
MRTVQTARKPTGGEAPKKVAPSTLRLIVERENKMTDVEAILGRLKRASVENFPGARTPAEALAPGISLAEIEEFETRRGVKLPDDVTRYFQCANGDAATALELFLPGLYLLPLKLVIEQMEISDECCSQEEAFQDEHCFPPGAIQGYYCDTKHWIPLAYDFAACSIAIDLAPGPKGKFGQVIVFGKHYMSAYCVVADSWSEFLDDYVSFIEAGEGFENGFQDPIIYMDMIYCEKVKAIKEKNLLGH